MTIRNKQNGVGDIYRPTSKGQSFGIDTPDSMSVEVHGAMQNLQNQIGDIDEYVRTKLGYKNQAELNTALSAEQIDAVAMGIFNIEKNQFYTIIGDQTGIGKGRIAASMIRYAIKKGLIPVFITEKPGLFSSFHQDLVNIGSGHLRAFIVNAATKYTVVKDIDGNDVYQPPTADVQKRIIASKKLPKGYDFVMVTYSQLSGAAETQDKKTKKTVYNDLPKLQFIKYIAAKSIVVMDESHTAAGESNTGDNLKSVIAFSSGGMFLSGTFAKRPDNMPIYAMRTCIQEANLTDEKLVLAIKWGGVALQEVISSQLVAQGQMIRRERNYEGIEVNYITTDHLAKQQRETADIITSLIREIQKFQSVFIAPEIKGLDAEVAAEYKQVEQRKGTKNAGVDNQPFANKIFQTINQMLFAIKADFVADHVIERLKQGKAPLITFSNTMGSFLETLENADGTIVGDGDTINADFSTVLIRGLEGIFRYTITDDKGDKEYKTLNINSFSKEAQDEYKLLVYKIKNASTNIVISPIDYIKQKIEAAGYTVGEVTGRKYELILSTRKVDDVAKVVEPKKQKTASKNVVISKLVSDFVPDYQLDVVKEYGEEKEYMIDLLTKMVDAIPNYPKNLGKDMIVYARFFYGDSQWFVLNWDKEEKFLKCFVVLNGDYQMAETGNVSIEELHSIKPNSINQHTGKRRMNGIELDFYWNPKPLAQIKTEIKQEYGGGVGKLDKAAPAPKTMIVGTLKARTKQNVSDAYRLFNENKFDVLMINQAGAVGQSGHAAPNRVVPANKVRQRVGVCLQANLDISTEMQVRGRINRTGQIYKPIYDYITCAIPAEKRLMMMLQKKLKSLDANTASNQKNSESILKSDDFLNKYGDRIVTSYCAENGKFNRMIGDPLKNSNDDAAHRVSGRVAMLSCKDQEDFYEEITDRYKQYVQMMYDQNEYDLEVEITDLKAKTIEKMVLLANPSTLGSPFSDNTYIEKCEVNVMKKPYTVSEMKKKIAEISKNPDANNNDAIIEEARKTILSRKDELEKEINSDHDVQIKNIEGTKRYKSIKASAPENIAQYVKNEMDYINGQREIEIERNRNRYTNQFVMLTDAFRFFYTSRNVLIPDRKDVNVPLVMGIVLGFKFGANKRNKFAPANVSLVLALANSTKQVTLNFTSENEDYIKNITDYSSSKPSKFE
jgi:hypothetical protein